MASPRLFDLLYDEIKLSVGNIPRAFIGLLSRVEEIDVRFQALDGRAQQALDSHRIGFDAREEQTLTDRIYDELAAYGTVSKTAIGLLGRLLRREMAFKSQSGAGTAHHEVDKKAETKTYKSQGTDANVCRDKGTDAKVCKDKGTDTRFSYKDKGNDPHTPKAYRDQSTQLPGAKRKKEPGKAPAGDATSLPSEFSNNEAHRRVPSDIKPSGPTSSTSRSNGNNAASGSSSTGPADNLIPSSSAARAAENPSPKTEPTVPISKKWVAVKTTGNDFNSNKQLPKTQEVSSTAAQKDTRFTEHVNLSKQYSSPRIDDPRRVTKREIDKDVTVTVEGSDRNVGPVALPTSLNGVAHSELKTHQLQAFLQAVFKTPNPPLPEAHPVRPPPNAERQARINECSNSSEIAKVEQELAAAEKQLQLLRDANIDLATPLVSSPSQAPHAGAERDPRILARRLRQSQAVAGLTPGAIDSPAPAPLPAPATTSVPITRPNTSNTAPHNSLPSKPLPPDTAPRFPSSAKSDLGKNSPYPLHKSPSGERSPPPQGPRIFTGSYEDYGIFRSRPGCVRFLRINGRGWDWQEVRMEELKRMIRDNHCPFCAGRHALDRCLERPRERGRESWEEEERDRYMGSRKRPAEDVHPGPGRYKRGSF